MAKSRWFAKVLLHNYPICRQGIGFGYSKKNTISKFSKFCHFDFCVGKVRHWGTVRHVVRYNGQFTSIFKHHNIGFSNMCFVFEFSIGSTYMGHLTPSQPVLRKILQKWISSAYFSLSLLCCFFTYFFITKWGHFTRRPKLPHSWRFYATPCFMCKYIVLKISKWATLPADASYRTLL